MFVAALLLAAMPQAATSADVNAKEWSWSDFPVFVWRHRYSRKPLPEEPAHAEVFGGKTKSVKRAFARSSEWIVPPPARQAPL